MTHCPTCDRPLDPYDRRRRCRCHREAHGRPLPEPTAVRPGPEKVSVLAERFERGEQLFHPLDCFDPRPNGEATRPLPRSERIVRVGRTGWAAGALVEVMSW